MKLRDFKVLLISLAALGGVLASAGTALAGGWAVTTLDSLPDEVRAGHTYSLGYTILQHGLTPFQTSESAIVITSRDGQKQSFAGKAQGAVGHYVAEVRFPAAGEWSWEVRPGPFEPQRLAPVTVLAAGGASGTQTGAMAGGEAGAAGGTGRSVQGAARDFAGVVAPTARLPWPVHQLALPVATVCAGALFALQVFEGLRRRRLAASAGAGKVGLATPSTARQAA
jgi:hypothetical protein